MPIPTPQSGESEQQFFERCMSSDVMEREFPDENQRQAVCHAQWRNKGSNYHIETKAYKPRQWSTIDRKRATFRRQFRPKMSQALDKSVAPFFEKLQRVGDISTAPSMNINIDNSPIQEVYKELYMEVGSYFGNFDRRNAKKKKGIVYLEKQGEDEIYSNVIREEMQKYAEEVAGQNIAIIADTSRTFLEKTIRSVVKEVLEEGLGAGEAQTMLRDRLTNQWHRAMRYRTERIVRTETTTASNVGSLKGIRSTGIPHMKIWSAAFDSNTREWHANANGQRVDMDSAFMVGGEQMDHPGDPSASGRNVINCRCAVIYEPK